MTRCARIRQRRRHVCIGDLKTPISVYSRNISSSFFGSAENTQNYQLFENTHAVVETTRGIDLFDGVNVSGEDGVPTVATIIFYIRFKQQITSEYFVRFENDNYQILLVENMDLRNEFLKLYCALRGDFDILANQ